MGFLKKVPAERPNPHPRCPTPPYTAVKLFGFSDKPDYGLGTLWKCDKCGKVWQLVQHSRWKGRPGDTILHAVWQEVTN